MQLRWLPTTLLVDLPNWVGDQMMALPALHRLVEENRGGLTVLHTRPHLTRFLASGNLANISGYHLGLASTSPFVTRETPTTGGSAEPEP